MTKAKSLPPPLLMIFLRPFEDYFVITLPLEKLATGDQLPDERFLSYGQLVWMAVPIDEHPERGKSIVKTRMKRHHPDLPRY